MNLVFKAVNIATNLVAVSQSAVELNRCFFKMHNSLVDVFSQQLDPISQLSILTIQDLNAEFLFFNFFLTTSLVTLELIDAILLLLLNVVLVSDVRVKLFNVSSG